MKRMTAAEPRNAEADASQDAVTLNGLPHIYRTSWVKATRGRQQWRNSPLVETEDTCYEFAHRRKSLRTSVSKSVKAAEAAGLRGLMTIDHPDGSSAR